MRWKLGLYFETGFSTATENDFIKNFVYATFTKKR